MASDPVCMLALAEVSKSFAGKPVLRSLSLDAARGRTTVLIGPSGCGKSTILRLIIGLEKADSGSIQIDNAPITPESIIEQRRRIGYVIQEGGLFPHLDTRRNITLLARYLGWNAARIEERVEQLRSIFKIPTDLLDRYPTELSGGQRQRVSIMRAMMLDPDLLLLDEPLAALDPMIRFDLQQELRDIFSDMQKTVILVTHDMGEAGHFGDTIVLLNDGEIVQRGSMADLLKHPAQPFVERFIMAQRQHWRDIDEQAR